MPRRERMLRDAIRGVQSIPRRFLNAEDAKVGAEERRGGSSRAAKIFRTTLNPEPRTLNPEPRTLNPEPRTLNLERKRCAAWCSKFEVQGSTVQSLFGCGLAAL